MTHAPKRDPLYYKTAPLEMLTLTDLTDALGVQKAADLLETSRRTIYTVRNTNVLGVERQLKLIAAVRANESACRERLIVLRRRQLDKHIATY